MMVALIVGCVVAIPLGLWVLAYGQKKKSSNYEKAEAMIACNVRTEEYEKVLSYLKLQATLPGSSDPVAYDLWQKLKEV